MPNQSQPARFRRIVCDPILWVPAMALLLLVAHLNSRLYVDALAGWDAAHYWGMAVDEWLKPAEKPFAYRWLPHRIMDMTPLPPRRLYEVSTWLCLWLAAVALGRLLRRAGVGVITTCGLVVLGLLWARFGGRFTCWYRFATEPLAFALILWAMVASQRARFLWVALLGCVGALTREHVLLVFPWVYLEHYGLRLNPKGLVRVALMAAPAAAVFVWVRMVTPVTGDYTMAGAVLASVQEKLLTGGGFYRLVSGLLVHNGMFLTALWVFPGAWRRLRRHPEIGYWILVNLLLGVVGGTDTDRLMYFAFPAEALLLGMMLSDAGGAWTHRRLGVLGVAVMGQLVISQAFSASFHPATVLPGWNLLNWFLWTLLLVLAYRAWWHDPLAPARS